MLEADTPRATVYPAKVGLMQAETWPDAFSREGWVFELKYDGYRLLASKDDDGRRSSPARQATVVRSEPVQPAKSAHEVDVPALPAGSGSGRRVVFSEGQQRVWLVSDAGDVLRTYLVSGSIYDNLDPGTYAVFSRSRWMWPQKTNGILSANRVSRFSTS